jgi:hypothetical protein
MCDAFNSLCSPLNIREFNHQSPEISLCRTAIVRFNITDFGELAVSAVEAGQSVFVESGYFDGRA